MVEVGGGLWRPFSARVKHINPAANPARWLVGCPSVLVYRPVWARRELRAHVGTRWMGDPAGVENCWETKEWKATKFCQMQKVNEQKETQNSSISLSLYLLLLWTSVIARWTTLSFLLLLDYICIFAFIIRFCHVISFQEWYTTSDISAWSCKSGTSEFGFFPISSKCLCLLLGSSMGCCSG